MSLNKQTGPTSVRCQYSEDFEIPSRPASSVRFSTEIVTYTDSDDPNHPTTPSLSPTNSYSNDFESDEETKPSLAVTSSIRTEVPSYRPSSESVQESISYEDTFLSSSQTSDLPSVTDTNSLFDTELVYSTDFDEETSSNQPSWRSSSTQTLSDTDHKFNYKMDEYTKGLFIAKCMNNLRLKSSIGEENRLESSEIQRSPHCLILNKRSEVDAMKSYCVKCIRSLRNPASEASVSEVSSREQLTGIRSTDLVESYNISEQIINQLRLENTKKRLKKIADMELHEVSKCPQCRVKYEEMAEIDFIKKSMAVVTEKLITDKVEWDSIRSHNPILLFGEAVRDLPNAKMSSRELLEKWQERLLQSRQPPK